jgi:four helix bundle protein
MKANNNVVRDKSYAFALRVVNANKYLVEHFREYSLSKQLLRSGTAIGANVEEAIGGQSTKDFQSKIAIAYKEARESHYWIRLLRDSNYLDSKAAKSLLNDCQELQRIIGSINKTVKEKLTHSSINS